MRYWIFVIIFLLLAIFTSAEYKRNSRRYEENNNEKIKKLKTLNIISMVAAVTATIICLAFGAFLLFNPLSRSNKSVRNHVLEQIPIGTSWDESIKIIKKETWEIKQTNAEYGLRINDKAENVSFASQEDMAERNNSNIRIVGSEAMFVELGEYYAPFNTAVFAYLAFDENEQLIEVAIRRDIDAP